MTVFESIVGNITRIKADAIVNAARRSLGGGGGVDGAIHRAAGPELRELGLKVGPCEPGEARITPGLNLPADWIIHTVGPMWFGGTEGEPELLANCYRNSLRLAVEARASHIVFPGISTGAYGYPWEEATRIAVTEISAFITKNPDALERVTLIWLDQEQADQASALIAEVSQ